MTNVDPNSFSELEGKDAPAANPTPTAPTGTENAPDTSSGINYEVKFKESQKEALRLLQEKRELERKLQERNSAPSSPTYTAPTDTELFPGFEQLDPEAQQNLIAYTNVVTKKAQEAILADPAISFARHSYNTQKWDAAFTTVTQQFPDLAQHKEEFKAQFFNAQHVPDNIEELLADLAKIYLFDKAKEIGAEEERKRLERIDLEDVTGGDKTPTGNRSLDDWQRMARENPAEFARRSKEFNEDMAAGRI